MDVPGALGNGGCVRPGLAATGDVGVEDSDELGIDELGICLGGASGLGGSRGLGVWFGSDDSVFWLGLTATGGRGLGFRPPVSSERSGLFNMEGREGRFCNRGLLRIGICKRVCCCPKDCARDGIDRCLGNGAMGGKDTLPSGGRGLIEGNLPTVEFLKFSGGKGEEREDGNGDKGGS